MKHHVILLATDDSAVEGVIKSMSDRSDWELKPIRTSREVVSMLMDGTLNRSLAVVDLDLRDGARGLLNTVGGTVPVIAITRKVGPWLASMLNHHRVEATLTKPVSLEGMSEAVERVRLMPEEARER